MAFDEQYAAHVLKEPLDAPGGHAVIFGAGASTRAALATLTKTGIVPHLRGILDDKEVFHGSRVANLPVSLPEKYPTCDIDCVYITSESHESELARRAKSLLGNNIPIRYTFRQQNSLVAKINQLDDAVMHQWPNSTPRDAEWLAADRLATRLRDRLANTPNWRYGPDRQLNEFAELNQRLTTIQTWRGCRFYNFGCGLYHPLGLSVLASLAGAEYTAATDLHVVRDEQRSATATLELIHEVLDRADDLPEYLDSNRTAMIHALESFVDLSVLRQRRLNDALSPNRCLYRVESIQQCTLPDNAFDIIASRSVFEHLAHPLMVLRRLDQLMRNGGIMILNIDFSDHRMYQDSSTYSHWSHLRDLDEPTYLDTNRLRFPDYPPLFEKAGLQLLQYTANLTESVPSDEHMTLAPRFRNMDESDLAVMSATAVLRKNH